MNKVAAAIIGCGKQGVNTHAVTAARSDKIRLVAVCDSNATRARTAADMLGVSCYTDHRGLLGSREVEAVIIATDTPRHASIAVDAAQAGKHILIEKPLADSVSASSRILNAIETAEVTAFVGFQLRFTEFAERLRSAVTQIDPLQIILTDQRGIRAPQYFIPDHYGGIMDSAAHSIHQGLWLMEGVPDEVYATLSRGTVRNDRTIDVANLLISYDGGDRTFMLAASMFGQKMPASIQVVGRRGNLSAIGRKKLNIVSHEGYDAEGVTANLEKVTVEVEDDRRSAVSRMLDHFADVIRGNAPHRQAATIREGMMAVAVTEAMAESAATKAPVSLQRVLGKGVGI